MQHCSDFSPAQTGMQTTHEERDVTDDILVAVAAAAEDETESESDRSFNVDLQCPLCRYVAETDAVLEVHVNTDHNDEPFKSKNVPASSFSCFVCSAIFSSEGQCREHLDGHFLGKSLPSSVNKNQSSQCKILVECI
jgi:hypothetical protein